MQNRNRKKDEKVATDHSDDLYSHINKLSKIEKEIRQRLIADFHDRMTEIITEISDSDKLSPKERIDCIKSFRKEARLVLEAITPPIPSEAPILWKNRGKENYHMSPCDFVVQHYPSLGLGLSQADLGRLDPQLISALRNWRDKHGWPANFDLPSQSELNARKINELTKAEIEDVAQLGFVIRDRQKRNIM